MVTVGGGQVCKIRTMLVQQRVGRKVSTKTARCNDDRAMFLKCLPIAGDALAAADIAITVSQQLCHFGLEQDPGTVGRLSNLLQLLHQAIGDGHTWKPLLAAMCARHRVSTKPGDQAQVHAELVNDPVHGRCALVAQHGNKVRTARATSHSVFYEDLRAIWDLVRPLRLRESPVDATSGLGAVAPKEGILVNHADLDAVLHHSVRRRETAQSATDHDNLLHP
mmetsp:Transcript_42317/g.101150  ORF Transcript_42317/g.101150 Transcript_42317/m.101150 type:complete len:222 (-) Transcript_42317:95-760(-)